MDINEEDKKTRRVIVDKDSVLGSVILDFCNVRTVLTLGAFGCAYFLCINEKAVPQFILSVCDFMLGFWFGQKVAKAFENGIIKKDGAK